MQLVTKREQEQLYQYQTKQTFFQKRLQETKKGCCTLIKVLIQQENITIIYTDVPNNRQAKYMKQKLTELKAETDNPTIIPGDLKTLLSMIEQPNTIYVRKQRT